MLVGGVVTHRQRPATAGGITFLNLEDETGHDQRDLLAGAVGAPPPGGAGSPGAAGAGPAGARPEGVINVVADRLQKLVLAVPVRSRDFR